MTVADIIIIVCVVAALSAVIYFSLIRKRKNPCKGCAYSKDCAGRKRGCVNTRQPAGKKPAACEECREVGTAKKKDIEK